MATHKRLKKIKETFDALTKTQKKSIFIIFGVIFVIKFLPLTDYISQTYSLAFHELGHAVTAWCFGHFAIPRFDFINGGGITNIFPRSFLLSVIIFALIVANFLYIKKQADAYTMKNIWIVIVLFLAFFFTDLHYSLITFMGKGGELLFCYLIAWHALYQVRSKINTKAIIYLLLSFLLWVNSVEDSVLLLFNDEDKSKYLAGIQRTMGGDPLMNDLVKLSNSSGLAIEFFNYLLLFFALLTLYKILKIANTAPISKTMFYQYARNLSTATISQVKNIKNISNIEKIKKIKRKNTRNKNLKK